jgi:hypothetical protein
MDEEDGKPGACSRQLGYSNAPAGVPPQSLFRTQFAANSRQQTVISSRPSAAYQLENIPQRLKPRIPSAFCGTTEVVPFQSVYATDPQNSAPACSPFPVCCLLLAVNKGELHENLSGK